MLHVSLLAPFPSAARQAQFDAVRAALAAESPAPATLLVGNLPLPDGSQLDALVVRPHGITLLLLEPRGGQLTIRDFAHSAWQLAGAPLVGTDGADNPFQQFSQQKEALRELLRPLLGEDQANLNFLTGLLLFGQPVVFGREVEERMAAVPAAASFHLLADPARFTRRLAQLATPEFDLTATDLAHLAQALAPAGGPAAADPLPQADEADAAEPASRPAPAPEGSFLRQKATALWHWLGAHDVDDLDAAPYGYDDVAAREQEKQALERLRTSLQADVAAQLRALEAREAEREQSLAQLRQQLAAAPPVAPEAEALQARITAESREKELLEAAMQASRAESAARNRELDAKIEQLSRLMQQMQAAGAPTTPPAAPAHAPTPAAAAPAQPGGPPPSPATSPNRVRWLRKWRRRLPRVALLGGGGLLVLLLVGWLIRSAVPSSPRRFEQGGRWGLLAADGDTLVPARYASLTDFRAGQAVVEAQGAFGLVDEKGTEIIAPAYDAINPAADGYARVRIGDLYSFVDEQGEEFSQYYFNALDFSEGRAAVLDRRGWFYISGPAPETKPPVLFQEAYSFHEGLARVKRQGAYTFITADYLDEPTADTKPFGRYTDAADFVDGRARVVQNGRTFYIDKDGDPVK